jgi:hypothetical protein
VAQQTLNKVHFPNSVAYDGFTQVPFDNVASIGASVANTTITGRVVLPFNMKIFGAYVNFSATGTALANHALNIVMGTAAEAGTVPANWDPNTSTMTLAVTGQSILAADFALSTQVADTPFAIAATNPDAVWPKGALMTLRAVTPASTGSFTNLKVTLFGVPFDIKPWNPNGSILSFSADL